MLADLVWSDVRSMVTIEFEYIAGKLGVYNNKLKSMKWNDGGCGCEDVLGRAGGGRGIWVLRDVGGQ